MPIPQKDDRSPQRRALDEQIAAEAPLPLPELPDDAKTMPMEVLRDRQFRHPKAVVGIVENGVVRPLDPEVKLAEHSRVIIVAVEAN